MKIRVLQAGRSGAAWRWFGSARRTCGGGGVRGSDAREKRDKERAGLGTIPA
jgi:hypothetical protein